MAMRSPGLRVMGVLIAEGEVGAEEGATAEATVVGAALVVEADFFWLGLGGGVGAGGGLVPTGTVWPRA